MNTLTPRDDRYPDRPFLNAGLAFTSSVADWALRQAQRCIERRQIDEALGWNHVAAGALRRNCRPLVSATIERNLLEIASLLPRYEWRPTRQPGAPLRWLHVIDNALPFGGHTAMARRWITTGPENNVHSVALPDQHHPVPPALADAVRSSGGEIFQPEPNGSLLSRAIWLRKLASAKADRVVLHIGNDNVVAPAAFGVDGGPPVVFVDHSGHLFWIGVAIADVAINGRGSESEDLWLRHFRGIPKVATLPIPIPLPQEEASGHVFTPEYRAQARQRLNLPGDAVVLLSVGRDEKYRPISGLDFFETAYSLLSACPKAWAFLVGPTQDERRKQLSAKLNGRLVVTGLQFNLRDYYAAADIYLESFPFGSTTALLEAGVYGLPCVLAPADCPPPFGTDGIALDSELHRPLNVGEYAKQVEELITDSEERLRRGRSLARSVRAHHCGEGWKRYLSELCSGLPQSHSVRPVLQPPAPPEEFALYWARCFGSFEGDPLYCAFLTALSLGLTPGLDLPLYHAWRAARGTRKGWLQATAPLMLSALLPFCPAAARKTLFRSLMNAPGARRRPRQVLHALQGVIRRLFRRGHIAGPSCVESVTSVGSGAVAK